MMTTAVYPRCVECGMELSLQSQRNTAYYVDKEGPYCLQCYLRRLDDIKMLRRMMDERGEVR